jgi:hypothetical protein
VEVSGHLLALATLLPGKESPVPLDRWLGGPRSWSGCGGEEKNSQPRDKILNIYAKDLGKRLVTCIVDFSM